MYNFSHNHDRCIIMYMNGSLSGSSLVLLIQLTDTEKIFIYTDMVIKIHLTIWQNFIVNYILLSN